MEKAIRVSKQIIKELDKDWMQELEDNNLHSTFGAIYSIPNIDIEDKNRIICFIIYAYSPESLWLDLKRDRLDNKKRILDSLGANTSLEIYTGILNNSHDIVGMCTFNFLSELKDWRWSMIFSLLDYSSRQQRFASEDTDAEKTWEELNKEGKKETLKEEIDISQILKINKDKGALLQLSIEKRMQADEMIEQIRKDYVATDVATQSDFRFKFTDTSKQRDILSWRKFIKERNERKKVAV